MAPNSFFLQLSFGKEIFYIEVSSKMPIFAKHNLHEIEIKQSKKISLPLRKFLSLDKTEFALSGLEARSCI